MPDNTAAIAAIRSLLESGATSVSTDGQTTTFDPAALRSTLAELERTDTANSGANAARKPITQTIYLGSG